MPAGYPIFNRLCKEERSIPAQRSPSLFKERMVTLRRVFPTQASLEPLEPRLSSRLGWCSAAGVQHRAVAVCGIPRDVQGGIHQGCTTRDILPGYTREERHHSAHLDKLVIFLPANRPYSGLKLIIDEKQPELIQRWEMMRETVMFGRISTGRIPGACLSVRN